MRYINLDIKDLIKFWLETKKNVKAYHKQHMNPNKQIIEKTRKLKGLNKGKKAFVFGNGPSLNKLDPHKVFELQNQGFHVWAVNSYINSDFGDVVIPDYYVFSDPAHFGRNLNLLNKKRVVEVKEDMDKVIKHNITMFMPVQFYQNLQYEKKYAFCDAENYFSGNVADITKPRGYCGFTTYKALAITCYLGYEKIYVCGIDNNYFKSLFVDRENRMFYENSHFYKQTSNDNNDVYRVPATDAKSVGELLYIHHFFFKHLEKFKDFPIVNLDPTGLVDCFTKKHDLDVYL